MFWKIKLRSYFILFSNDNNKIQFVGELLIDLIEYKKHTSVKIVFWPLCRVQIAQSMAQKWAAPWEKNSTDISAISVLFCISGISKTSTIMPCRIGGSLPCFTQLHIQRERERGAALWFSAAIPQAHVGKVSLQRCNDWRSNLLHLITALAAFVLTLSPLGACMVPAATLHCYTALHVYTVQCTVYIYQHLDTHTTQYSTCSCLQYSWQASK